MLYIRYFRRPQTGGDGGARLGMQLNSGTMKMNGSDSPVSTVTRTQVHAEPHPLSGG